MEGNFVHPREGVLFPSLTSMTKIVHFSMFIGRRPCINSVHWKSTSADLQAPEISNQWSRLVFIVLKPTKTATRRRWVVQIFQFSLLLFPWLMGFVCCIYYFAYFD